MAQAFPPPHHHYRGNSDLEPRVSPIQTEFTSQFGGRGGVSKHPDVAAEDVSSSPVSPIMSRRTSYDSDRRSTVSGLTSAFPSNPTNVDPAPLYVAGFGASQVVSEHQAARSVPAAASEESEEEDGKNNKDDVQFSDSALALVNAFLDQLLYSILSHARSTSLGALRPAVTEVLKHRLARDAISSADSELAELLAGGDEEEDIDIKHKAQEEKRTWDLELVWKRTRLRVMVYMRLGEMEDDDEQRYVRQEERFYGSERRFSSSTGLVSWSAAIFLTSVLEYVAEQALQIAGQAAYVRIRRQSRSHRRSMSSDVLRGDLVVEEHDVEKVALNSLLGRLWRSWRKSLRSTGNGVVGMPGRPTTPMLSRRGTESTIGGTRQSFDTPRENGSEIAADESRPISRDGKEEVPEVVPSEQDLVANIPLPFGNEVRDIDEILVPGLARDPDAKEVKEVDVEKTEGDDKDVKDETDEAEKNVKDIKDEQEKEEEGPYPALLLGTLVALPMLDEKRDVEEIEVPGLAIDPDNMPKAKKIRKQPARRKSFAEFSHGVKRDLLTLNEPVLDEPAKDEAVQEELAQDRPAQDESVQAESSRDESASYKSAEEVTQEEAAHDEFAQSKPTLDESAHGEITPARSVQDGSTPDESAGGESAIVESAPEPADDIRLRDFSRQRSKSHPLPVLVPLLPAEELEEEEEEPEDDTQKTQDEQKSNVEDVPAQELESGERGVTRELPNGDKSAESQKAEYPWMGEGNAVARAGAALAAAAATAGATAVAVSKWSSSSATGDQSEKITDAGEKSVQGDAVSGSEKAIMKPTQPERDVEELDKRKSLLNVKHMMFVNGKSEDSSTMPSPATTVDRSVSSEEQEGVLVESAEQKGGIESSTKEEETRIPELEAQQANKRPRDLAIDTSAPAAPEDISTKGTTTPRTPRTFLDLTADSDSAAEQPVPPPVNATQVSTLTNGVASERPPSTKSASEREVKRQGSAPSIKKKPSSESGTVQEHPVVQRMASRKGSEPSSASGSEKHLPLTSAAIKGPEDFDLFVQGSETLKYTLTPEHMRDPPAGDQTRYAKGRESPVPVELDATPATRDVVTPPDSRTGRTMTIDDHQTPTQEKRRSQSRPSQRNTSTHRRSGLMAREPRVQTDSTRDFADFIRSTGPDKDTTVAPILRNPSQTSLKSLRSAHIRGASASRSSSPRRSEASSRTAASSKTATVDDDAPPVPPIPRSKRSGMQARGAKIEDNGSSALIDFIRTGPKEEGVHRISRSVAPFRTTMDSDRLNGENGGEASRGTSLSVGEPSTKAVSMKSSANSRSALLNGGTNGAAPAVQKAPQASSSAAATNGQQKKIHRNKDPYAIDFDDLFDDDADDETPVVASNTTTRPQTLNRDESFLEFLRNHEPVSSGPVRPLIDPNSAQARRIINNARNNKSYSTGPQQAQQARTISNSNGGPKQTFPPYSPSNGVAQLNSSVSSSPTPAKSRLQAKTSGSKLLRAGGGTSVDNTNDLAYFIRNSGPPDDPNTAPAPEVGRGVRATSVKSEGKKKRGSIFGGKKNTRYLDMP